MKRTLAILALLLPLYAAADRTSGLNAFVKEDFATAYKESRPFAYQGDAYSQANLGWMYLAGKGVKQDFKEAVKWSRKAADQGHAFAQLNLGVMYQNGNGVVRNLIQAYKLYSLAAKSGYTGAAKYRDSIASFMTPDQISEAQSLFTSFRPIKGKPTTDDTSTNRDAEQGTEPKAKKRYPDTVPKPSFAAINREAVRKIQSHLTALGYNPGPADGLPGKRTSAAVKEYQRVAGIQPDGILSTRLLKALKRTLAQKPKPKQPANTEPRLVSSGSGFIVGKDYVVTNRHVIDSCPTLVINLDGRRIVGNVTAKSNVDDLAVVKLTESASYQAKFRRSGLARLGEDVRVAGFPLRGILAESLNIVSGEVSALAGFGNNVREIQVSAPVQPGNSGGPLLDSSGNVVGVVVSKLNAVKFADATGDIPQNINFAIKGVIVKSFLDIHGIDYQTALSDVEKLGEDIAAEAKRFTVPIECYK